MEHAGSLAPKNLVICCDGTGNEISENISNVLKLYRCLRKTDRAQPQQMFYKRRHGVRADHGCPISKPRATRCRGLHHP